MDSDEAGRHERTQNNTEPFARKAATWSWILGILGWLSLAYTKPDPDDPPSSQAAQMSIPPLLLLFGFAMAIVGLIGALRYRRRDILIPALVGLVLTGLPIVGFVRAILGR